MRPGRRMSLPATCALGMSVGDAGVVLDGTETVPTEPVHGGHRLFARLGRTCVRRRGWVVAAWAAVLIVGGVATSAVGPDFRSEFALPDVESRAGFDVIESSFAGLGAGERGTVVFESPDGFSAEERAAASAFLDRVAGRPDVTVVSPFAPGGELQVSPLPGRAGTIAFATVELAGEPDRGAIEDFGAAVVADAPQVDGLRVEFGGQMFSRFEPPESELLGLAFAIVILILAFGSVLAMGLPIGVALGGIGVGSMLLVLLSNVTTMPDFATSLGVMIGLGVGIDYALFIVTRYREQLREGHGVTESVAIALDTSGRAVAFAGLTVVISLLGMLLMGVGFVTGLGIGAAVVVTVTMVASLTLLPALLGFVGERVDRTRWRGLVAACLVAVGLVGAGLSVQPLLVALPLALVVLVAGSVVPTLRREVPRRVERPLESTVAYRWSRLVQRRPVLMAGGATLALLLLALPVLDLRLGFADAGNDPPTSTTRQAYDLLAEGFGPGFNGPLTLVAELPEGVAAEDLGRVAEAVGADPGVAFVTPASTDDPAAPTAAIWQVFPTTSPQDAATTELVQRLRAEVLPGAEPAGTEVLVTGFVAVTVDFADYLAGRLVVFFAAVLALSFLLLLIVFRSVLVPLKAVFMNLLSIGAAYGVLVAVFQWGWLSSLVGVEPAPVEPFVPMMLFAIVFGLSMDYEVFLLSRVREEWLRSGDSSRSVADGLAATARVITAAAAIMVFVFGSFVLEDNRSIKLFGLGLAVAVLLDATIVRLLLVPATMELLGDRNWWIPRWLDRILPTLHVEGPGPNAGTGEGSGAADRELEPVG